MANRRTNRSGYREYKSCEKQMREADEMMRDSSLDHELRELAEEEFDLDDLDADIEI